LGGLEQAKAISLASFSPSKIRATAGIARGLRRPSFHTPNIVVAEPYDGAHFQTLEFTHSLLGHAA
jgi:hypothetical protein